MTSGRNDDAARSRNGRGRLSNDRIHQERIFVVQYRSRRSHRTDTYHRNTLMRLCTTRESVLRLTSPISHPIFSISKLAGPDLAEFDGHPKFGIETERQFPLVHHRIQEIISRVSVRRSRNIQESRRERRLNHCAASGEYPSPRRAPGTHGWERILISHSNDQIRLSMYERSLQHCTQLQEIPRTFSLSLTTF